MTILLLDVGNTYLKWGVAGDDGISKTGNIAQQKIRDKGLSVLTTRWPTQIDYAMASNVAGTSFATRLAGLVHAHCDCDLHFAKPAKKAYGLTNSYPQPRRLGVDRWVAMIGAKAEVRGACVVVDAGTAVTIDAVDAAGQHVGGQILPGIGLMVAALHDNTSDLPLVSAARKPLGDKLQMFGNRTRDAMINGAHNAVVGAVERAMKALRSGGYRPKLVLTGGDASAILTALDKPAIHRPHLVLQGLLHMLRVDQKLT